MASTISKIRLINFKRFRDYTIVPNEKINILIGNNEVGKSSILEAIDLVTSGNVRKMESIGLERLLNISAVQNFLAGARQFTTLPKMIVELYLAGTFDHTMNGKNNTSEVVCDGIRLVCEPNPDYRTEITEALQAQSDYFPYDYYSVRFSTFADEGYTGYKKKIRSILIDSSNMSSDYATNDFVRRMYIQYTECNVKERAIHKSQYRQMRTQFCANSLMALNGRVPSDKDYTFGLRPSSSQGFEGDLMIYEGNVGIDNKGTGKQVFIKTDFALEHSGIDMDVILIEEPENHLSHVNLRKLLQRVSGTQSGQIFVTTHNSMISTRLELNNLLILHDSDVPQPTKLSDLSDDTAKYFMKAPPASIVEFVLAQKLVLVEGPSEYMLFENFYLSVAGCSPEEDGVHILDVHGLSFKRYLEIAALTGAKVAVVTDNDGDSQKNCIDKYVDFVANPSIKIFYDGDITKYTFEILLYDANVALCDRLFGSNALAYMLNNKTESAYSLLDQDTPIVVPTYIKEAVEWIRG